MQNLPSNGFVFKEWHQDQFQTCDAHSSCLFDFYQNNEFDKEILISAIAIEFCIPYKEFSSIQLFTAMNLDVPFAWNTSTSMNDVFKTVWFG